MFKLNVGGIDRLIRVVLGIALLTYFGLSNGPLHWLGLVGVIPLLTGALGRCPLYSLFGLSTCPLHSNS